MLAKLGGPSAEIGAESDITFEAYLESVATRCVLDMLDHRSRSEKAVYGECSAFPFLFALCCACHGNDATCLVFMPLALLVIGLQIN